MKKCTLCGGKLDIYKRCTFCGLDNTKNDEAYQHLLNQNECADEPLTHVHGEEVTYTKSDKKVSGQLDAKTIVGIVIALLTIIASILGTFE